MIRIVFNAGTFYRGAPPRRAGGVWDTAGNRKTEIVRRVKELFSQSESVQLQYAEAVKQVEALTPSVLSKAFRGELVPQDPNDEPAGEMLERMLAHRTSPPK